MFPSGVAMSRVRLPAGRMVLLSMPVLALVGCSADGVLEPPAGVPAVASAPVAMAAPEAAPASDVVTFAETGTAAFAVSEGRVGLADDLPPVRDVLSYPSGQGNDGGGFAPVLPEGQTSAPVVDGIGTEHPQAASLSPVFASEPDPVIPEAEPLVSQPAVRTTPGAAETPEKESRIAGLLPRLNPFGRSDIAPGLPAAERDCRTRLKRLGVRFTDLPRIENGPGCVIAHPVQVTSLSGGIEIKPAAKLNCQITEAFALWVKKELAPAARLRYLSGIQSINQLSSYSCRTMNSRPGAPMSEHARGNAIDVGKITLNSGKAIAVREKGLFAFREKGLLNSVRADSCKYFTTVLGPGSDVHHRDHFHFDLRARKGGYRHCD